MLRSKTVRLSTVLASVLAIAVMATGGLANAGAADTTLRSGPAGHSVRVPADVPQWTVTQVLSFTDPLNGYHPMGVASNGEHLYTTNGGNAGACVVNTFSTQGQYQDTQTCTLDNRSIMFDPTNGYFFTKTYDDNAYRIDPATGQSFLKGSGWFAYSQSSPAVTPGGHYLLEQQDGTIRVLVKAGGALYRTLDGFQFGPYPSDEAVAMYDPTTILTWDGFTLYIQDWNHNVIGTASIPNGHYGFSLSYTNGMLFTADDVDANGNATWYGYTLTP